MRGPHTECVTASERAQTALPLFAHFSRGSLPGGPSSTKKWQWSTELLESPLKSTFTTPSSTCSSNSPSRLFLRPPFSSSMASTSPFATSSCSQHCGSTPSPNDQVFPVATGSHLRNSPLDTRLPDLTNFPAAAHVSHSCFSALSMLAPPPSWHSTSTNLPLSDWRPKALATLSRKHGHVHRTPLCVLAVNLQEKNNSY